MPRAECLRRRLWKISRYSKTALASWRAGAQGADGRLRVTATAMAHTGGRILVIAVGIVIAGIGLYMIRAGLTKAFLKDLRLTGASRRAREGVTALGMAGNIARGIHFR